MGELIFTVAMSEDEKTQFTEISDLEWEQVRKALLKYCELNTFAMVMIFKVTKEEDEIEKFKT